MPRELPGKENNFTVHGFAFQRGSVSCFKILIRLLSWITMILATDIILLSNRELAQASAFPFTKKKLHLTHNGIDAISSENSTQANTEIRDSFPQDSVIVGTIGELHPNKNQVALIEAAKLLPDKICFAIVGEGELRKNLENRISELKLNHRVKLFGFIKAYEAFPNFDIFVLPSIKEGLPFTIMESAIAGIPVIASNVGGIPEIIEDKHSGILVEQKTQKLLLTQSIPSQTILFSALATPKISTKPSYLNFHKRNGLSDYFSISKLEHTKNTKDCPSYLETNKFIMSIATIGGRCISTHSH